MVRVILLNAENSGSFVVKGNLDKYYPVLFSDVNWNSYKVTQLSIGRSDIHTDSTSRGSLIAAFQYHTYLWGHRSNFINAEIHQFANANNLKFIAGWRDASYSNGNARIIIWLRGGSTTYFYSSDGAVNPVVYDGVANALPFQEENGAAHTFKTQVDSTVNINGVSIDGTAYFNGSGNNYFSGDVGIGTTNLPASYKLAVAGKVIAEEIKVKLQSSGWPDYVFKPSYRLMPLSEVEAYIKAKGHLPDVPSSKDVAESGIEVGRNQAVLLKKIEELTLHLITMERLLKAQQADNKKLSKEIEALKRR